MTAPREMRDRVATMTFREMLQAVRSGIEVSQQDLAGALGYSPQYLCDLEAGRRKPSVAFVNRLCDYLGRGPAGRREWHLAAAAEHGWSVRERHLSTLPPLNLAIVEKVPHD